MNMCDGDLQLATWQNLDIFDSIYVHEILREMYFRVMPVKVKKIIV